MNYLSLSSLAPSLALLATILLSFPVAAEPPKVTATYGDGSQPFTLATGSPGEIGLLEALAQAFSRQTPITLYWVKAGSGEALDFLKARQVDVVLVHAPAAEAAAVKARWAVKPTLIGSNEFYLVGPADDPAKIREANSAVDAYRRIAAAAAPFISRADNSGTHKKEMQLWKAAGIEPQGDWYIPTHDFMTASLKRAHDTQGYFMTDSSTWIAERPQFPHLVVLFKGDKVLVNTYHALLAPPGATPGGETAARFVEFLASPQGQKVIHDYGKDQYGEPLYQDAAYAQRFVD